MNNRLVRLFGVLAFAALPSLIRAQNFTQIGGGWNNGSFDGAFTFYTGGFNIQASRGWALNSRVIIRGDALVTGYQERLQWFPPCPTPGCTHPYYDVHGAYVMGLLASTMVNVDRRGIAYVLGGIGAYYATGTENAWQFGASVGAGLAVPITQKFRLFGELRVHSPGTPGGVFPRFTPVTFGLRW